MTKKNVLLYIAALAVVFALGCGAALVLKTLDERDAAVTPLASGQIFDLSAHGITLLVPEGAVLLDYTENNLEYGGQARFAGCAGEGEDALHVFIYDNDQGDDISAYSAQELVTYYMGAGAGDVRLRDIAGRRFVCYRSQVESEDGALQVWDTYETWSASRHIVFETQLPAKDALSMLSTLTFTE